MTTWFLKDCPKCGGDLYKDPLISGHIVKCFQCCLEIKSAFVCLEEKPVPLVSLDMKHIKASVTHKY